MCRGVVRRVGGGGSGPRGVKLSMGRHSRVWVASLRHDWSRRFGLSMVYAGKSWFVGGVSGLSKGLGEVIKRSGSVRQGWSLDKRR